MKPSRLHWVVVLALVGTACGAGPSVDNTSFDTPDAGSQSPSGLTSPGTPPAGLPLEIGEGAAIWRAPECPYSPLDTFFVPVWVVLDDPTSWAEYEASSLATAIRSTLGSVADGDDTPLASDGDDFPGIIDVGHIEPVVVHRGAPPENTLVRIPDAEILLSALDSLDAATVLIGTSDVGIPEVDAKGGQALSTVLVTDAGEAMFAQECGDRSQAEFDPFVAEQTSLPAWTPADLARGFAQRDIAVLKARDTWADRGASQRWADQPPDARLLDPDITPPEVLAGLELVAIEFVVPDEWRLRTDLLCTAATLGWNECVTLDLDNTLEVSAYVALGESLAVRLIPSGGDLQEVIVEFGTIPADVLEGWDSINPIRVLFDDLTIAEAIDAANRGETTFAVE